MYKDDVIISKTKKLCLMCGKMTDKIGVYSEGRFCSEECLEKFYEEWSKGFDEFVSKLNSGEYEL